MTAPALRRNTETPAVIDALRARFGERLSTAAAVREQHGKDESYHAPAPPDAVVFAHSTEEVADIVKLCARAQDAGHSLRHRDLARRPCGGARGRHLDRSLADEPRAARQRRGSRLHRRGRA